jgi:uncharacterized membrane protein YhhN
MINWRFNAIKKNFPLGLFFFTATIHIAGILAGIAILSLITKPLLMPALMIYFITGGQVKWDSRPTSFILLALAFSFLGDVLLMFAHLNDLFFITGLTAFLLAHVFYIRCFVNVLDSKKQKIYPGLLAIAIGMLFLSIMLLILLPHIDSQLRIPIIVYAITITTVLTISMSLKKVLSPVYFNILLSGTILFVISDSLIAINKFYIPFSTASFLIMITYILAQFFIIHSLKKYLSAS